MSVPAGVALVALARGVQARAAALTFATSLPGMFGVSAGLLHYVAILLVVTVAR